VPFDLVHTTLILCDRTLEDIGKRSLAMSEKGKIARVLDKARDSGEVIKFIERLRQAILIYQVGIRLCWSRKKLTRGTGVTTTVNIQSSHPIDGGFPPLVFEFETKPVAGLFRRPLM
jgi:hypothetical protein